MVKSEQGTAMVDVFLSYARSERAKAEPIYNKLRAMGLDVFFDLEGIEGGDSFPDVINEALKASKAVLCCWSPVYFTRTWCLIECRFGQSRGRMIPGRIEAYDADAPPADLSFVNYRDLTDWGGDENHEGWGKVLRDLEGKIGRSLTEGPAVARTPGGGALEDLRRTWDNFPAREDPAAVARFLEKVRRAAPDSGLEFEVEHHSEQLAREKKTTEQAVRLSQTVDSLSEAAMEEILSTPTPGVVFRDPLHNGGEGPDMVVIPAGRFLMGSPKDEPQREPWKAGVESPQHEVTIENPFAIGRFAVTRGEFAAFVSATGHDMSGGIYWHVGKGWKKDSARSWGDPGFAQDDRHPVVGVSWKDAESYCTWLSEVTSEAYRLPSEAEWEYACRAGSTTPFWWGATITPEQANYAGVRVYEGGGEKGEYRKRTEPADAFEPNPWGLYQVHGNVLEWCADAWNESYEGAPNDGSTWSTGDTSRAVLRGGSWGSGPQVLRSAGRFRSSRDIRGNIIGFRVSRTLRGR